MAFNTTKKTLKPEEIEYSSSPTDQPSQSYLGKTLKIKGEIISDEILTVEGEVMGNINASKTLTIGKNGYVDGEIKAHVVKIDGKAQGNIHAVDKLQISSHGQFRGNIKANKLVIDEGAVFQGKANLDETTQKNDDKS